MGIELELGPALQWLSLFLAICGMFNYVVIKPLRLAIDDLRGMIAEVRENAEQGRRERHLMEVKLARVEDAAKSAHHRIDSLEQRK